MKPAGERLEEAMEDVFVEELKIPVVTNVEADLNRSKQRVKPLLVAQVYHPVRWEESMRRMIEKGIERMIEIGPGKVLTGLMKRIDSKIEMFNIEDIKSLKTIS